MALTDKTEEMNNMRSRRIASNTMLLFARMLIITLVNLYTVRWVLAGLGTEGYGIYNAVAGVVTASSCISSVLAMSTQRFYSYYIGKGNSDKLKEIFSVSVNITLLLSIAIVLLFETLGPWFIQSQLIIPAGRLSAALSIFHFSLVSFICTLIQIPFIGAVFSNENMNIYMIISTIDCIVKFIIAYMIGQSPIDSLVFYGLAMMIESIVVLGCYVCISTKKYQECRYKKVTEKSLYKEIMSFSGWTLYATTSSMGMIQGSIVLLNIFFGPLVNAAFNIANQVYNALITLSNSINMAVRPAMIKAYSHKEEKYLGTLFYASNKALYFLMIIVAIPVIFEAETILRWWLGNITSYMVVFTRLYIIFTVLLCLHNPITTIIQASGSIKKYTIYVESITILNIPICWILFKLGFPPFVLFVVMITLCIFAHIMRLIHLKAASASFSYKKYAISFVVPSIIITFVATITAGIIYSQMSVSLVRTLLIFTISPIVTILAIYLIGIDTRERNMIKNIVKQKLHI